MPPLASRGTRPLTWTTALRSCSSPRLSSRSMSAPAASASSICSGVLTSASTFSSGCAARRALRTASPMPPAAAAWSSLTNIPSKSAPRWLVPPPARTAAFSNSRIPGVVLRVSSNRVRVPASADAYRRVSVAMPQSRWRRLSAVRSPVRMARIDPRTRRTRSPGPASSPSPSSASNSHSGSSARNTRAAAEMPETTSVSLAKITPLPRAPAVTQASAVRSPGPTSSSRASAMSRPTASSGRPGSSGGFTLLRALAGRRPALGAALPPRALLRAAPAALASARAADAGGGAPRPPAHVRARLRLHRPLRLLLHLAAGSARALLRAARSGDAARLGDLAHLAGLVRLVLAAADALRTHLRLVGLRPAGGARLGGRFGLRDLRALLVLVLLRHRPALLATRLLLHQPARDGLHPRHRLGGDALLLVLVARLHGSFGGLLGGGRHVGLGGRVGRLLAGRRALPALHPRRGPAVRAHLIEAAVVLLSTRAVSLLLRILLFHGRLRFGDARQVTRELLPLSCKLFGAGAVLLHHFLGRTLDEARIVEAFADSLQLLIGARDLFFDAGAFGSEVDQAGQRQVDLDFRLDMHRRLPGPRLGKGLQLDFAGVGQVLEGALVALEERAGFHEQNQRDLLVGRQVHLAADAAGPIDGAGDHVHFTLCVIIEPRRVFPRKRRQHDGATLPVGQPLPDLLGDEGHEGVQEPQRPLQRSEQRRLRPRALALGLLA